MKGASQSRPSTIVDSHSIRTIALSIYATVLIGAALVITLQRRIRAPAPLTTSVSTNNEQHLRSNPEIISNEPLKLPLIEPKIVIAKSKRRLRLYSDNKLVRAYRIELGFNPVADKTKEGDGATPEGSFYIFTKNAKSKFYLSLGISYPNVEHAERGRRDGLITQAQYEQIVNAIRRQVGPPQNTPLGGQVYIHGNGAQRDWTWGCVALEDEDIKELFAAVPIGTPVIIEH